MPILRWSALALLLLAAVLVPFAIWGERVDTWVAASDWGRDSPAEPAAILAGLLAADGLLPVPSSLASALLGVLLGAAGGTLVSATAMTAGVLLAFLMSRWGGRPLALRLVGEVGLRRAADWLDRRGLAALVLCRPVPVLAEASVIAAGLGAMRLGPVLVATALSNLGISVVYAGAGAAAEGPGTFLLAFLTAILLPGAALLLARRVRPAGP